MRPSRQMSLFLTDLEPENQSENTGSRHIMGDLPAAGGRRRALLPAAVASSQKLASVDWDFPSSDDSSTVHAIHPYPAKFISDIPRALIRELGVVPGTAVFDPFCGCGTTMAVAQEFGIRSIGVDLNPIACLVSRVKTTPLPRSLMQHASSVAATAASARSGNVLPLVPNVDHWFDACVQQAIVALTDGINSIDDIAVREHLQVALSSIVVRVSRQESDTRYAAIAKNVTFDIVIEQFLQACSKVYRAKQSRRRTEPAHVMERNVLEVQPEQIEVPVSLVITSPPYPNAYEYWLYHKYRMWWLGYDPLRVKEQEIGARAHYFKKNHATYEQFVAQMRSVLRLAFAVLIPGGYACFVVGRSRIHGIDYDNGAMIEEVGSDEGFALIARLPRAIAQTRKSFNLSHARIKCEEIIVLQKVSA